MEQVSQDLRCSGHVPDTRRTPGSFRPHDWIPSDPSGRIPLPQLLQTSGHFRVCQVDGGLDRPPCRPQAPAGPHPGPFSWLETKREENEATGDTTRVTSGTPASSQPLQQRGRQREACPITRRKGQLHTAGPSGSHAHQAASGRAFLLLCPTLLCGGQSCPALLHPGRKRVPVSL